MNQATAIVFNSWAFGVPIVLLVWAVLRLLHRAPARLRYVLVVAAFAAGIAVPAIVASMPREVRVVASEGGSVAQAGLTLPVMLMLLWLSGTVLLLARELVGHLRLLRVRRSWDDAPAELRSLLEWPERFPLSVAPGAAPLTTGLKLPRVVLPGDLLSAFPLPVARRIALHELSHCRWRDPLVYAAMRFAASLFWFSPLWPLLRWARREREVAADEVALRVVTGDEESYVAALLRLSRVALAHRLAASPMAASDLEFRAARILAVTRRSSIVLSIVALTGAAAFASVVEPMRIERVVMVEPATKAAPMVVVPVEVPAAVPAVQPEPAKPRRARRARPDDVPRIAEEVMPEEPQPVGDTRSQTSVQTSVQGHFDVHVDNDVHVHVTGLDEPVQPAEAVGEAVRNDVRNAAMKNGEPDDERNVIRVVNVIRTKSQPRPSRWRSLMNAVRGR